MCACCINLGHACHYKVVGSLIKKFPTPKEAESHFCQSLSTSPSEMSTDSTGVNSRYTPIKCTVAVQTDNSEPTLSKSCQTHLSLYPSTGDDGELLVLSNLFSKLMLKKNVSVPENYVLYSAHLRTVWS